MNGKVFLVAADPNALSSAAKDLSQLNGLYLRPFAWVLPWQGGIEQLRQKLSAVSAGLGNSAVIAELEGGDFRA